MRAILVSVALLVAPAIALVPATAFAEDPPGRVGRVALIEGKLSEHTPGDATWFPATRNDPVAAGAGFWAEPGTRAELSVGADVFRLDGGSEITIERLDDNATGLTLSQGMMRVTSATQRPLRVNTPRGDVDVNGRAEIHVDAGTEYAPTRVAVLNGEAIVRTDDGEKRVGAGETATLEGSGPYRSEVTRGVEHSPFDTWADSRLQAGQAPPPKFVSAETTGYQDLATYGAWQEEPAYGAVWYPRDVSADWAPYRYGHWRSVAPWGWTWIDDSPWGYAPFHYGRWAFVGSRWGWVPGTYVARPVWAPALVAFAVVNSGGPVGWVPLAPREPYRPWYRASPRYLRAVNVTHVTNVTVIQRAAPITYANRSHATAVPQAVFAHGGPIGRAHESVDPARFDRGNRAGRAPSPAAMRAALPPPAAPQQAATAAPPPPPLQGRPPRGGPIGQAGGAPRFAPQSMPQAAPQPATPSAIRPAPPTSPAQQPNGRPALPRDDAARAPRPERFEGQRPGNFQRPDASVPGGPAQHRGPDPARTMPQPQTAPPVTPAPHADRAVAPPAPTAPQPPRPQLPPQSQPQQPMRPQTAPQPQAQNQRPQPGPEQAAQQQFARPQAAPQPQQQPQPQHQRPQPGPEQAAQQQQRPQQQQPQQQQHQPQPAQQVPHPQQQQPPQQGKKLPPTTDDPNDRSKSR